MQASLLSRLDPPLLVIRSSDILLSAMTLEEYNQILDQAFGFLIADCGYTSHPVPRFGGGRFGSGLSKTFTKDRQTITLMIGDADSSLFCDVFFSDGDDAQLEPLRRHFRYRTLYFLLLRKGIDRDFPDASSLGSDAAKKAALVECGKLVQEHAIDVVHGDFSAFPGLVYIVHHVDRQYPTGEVRRLIGVYSSLSRATEAIAERRTKPGFVVRQDGFEVDCFEQDLGTWTSGIPISPPQQATEFFRRTVSATSLSEFNADEQLEIESRWLSRFSEVQAAWSAALDQAELHRRRSELVDELRSRPIALECWRNERESKNLSSKFVAFIDAELSPDRSAQ